MGRRGIWASEQSPVGEAARDTGPYKHASPSISLLETCMLCRRTGNSGRLTLVWMRGVGKIGSLGPTFRDPSLPDASASYLPSALGHI